MLCAECVVLDFGRVLVNMFRLRCLFGVRCLNWLWFGAFRGTGSRGDDVTGRLAEDEKEFLVFLLQLE